MLLWPHAAGTKQGLALALLCALGAPACELVLMQTLGLWHYPDGNMLVSVAGGIPSWWVLAAGEHARCALAVGDTICACWALDLSHVPCVLPLPCRTLFCYFFYVPAVTNLARYLWRMV